MLKCLANFGIIWPLYTFCFSDVEEEKEVEEEQSEVESEKEVVEKEEEEVEAEKEEKEEAH